jgi:hypothetical protein
MLKARLQDLESARKNSAGCWCQGESLYPSRCRCWVAWEAHKDVAKDCMSGAVKLLSVHEKSLLV